MDLKFATTLPGLPPSFLKLHPYRELLDPSFPPYFSLRYSTKFALRHAQSSPSPFSSSASSLTAYDSSSGSSSSAAAPLPGAGGFNGAGGSSPAFTGDNLERAQSLILDVDIDDDAENRPSRPDGPRDRWFFTPERPSVGLSSWTFISSTSSALDLTFYCNGSVSADGAWRLLPDPASSTDRRWLHLETGIFLRAYWS